MRTILKMLFLAHLLLFVALPARDSANAAPLYFPHVDTSPPWHTEIALINTSTDQSVSGNLQAFTNAGQFVDLRPVTLLPNGRRQITVADEFIDNASVGYIVFQTDADTVQGYTKFSIPGVYRAAIPAVKRVNIGDIYVPHIDSSAEWWTGLSLVNTTPAPATLGIVFNNGQVRNVTLNPGEHRAFTIRSLFGGQPQPDIRSAVITNASGIIGLELFGSLDGNSRLEGVVLTDSASSTLYYPHVAIDNWWTGIVAYNPSESPGTMTISPFAVDGTALPPSTLPIEAQGKYIGAVSSLGLHPDTAWFRIDSTRPLSGFELFGTTNGQMVAAYGGGFPTNQGVFAKNEKDGWTGIALVNPGGGLASVILTAYDDAGGEVANSLIFVGGYSKLLGTVQSGFSQDISNATYVRYAADRNIIAMQLNGSADYTILDGLPALDAASRSPVACSNLAGAWAGTITRGVDIVPVYLIVSQDGCRMTAALTAIETCPGICSQPFLYHGSVQDNAASGTANQAPLMDCSSCRATCPGTSNIGVAVAGETMTCTVAAMNCQGSAVYQLYLTRVSAADPPAAR